MVFLDSWASWACAAVWLGAILSTLAAYTRSQKDGRAFICKVAKKVLMLDLLQAAPGRRLHLKIVGDKDGKCKS